MQNVHKLEFLFLLVREKASLVTRDAPVNTSIYYRSYESGDDKNCWLINLNGVEPALKFRSSR
jgi:hypothetical protein